MVKIGTEYALLEGDINEYAEQVRRIDRQLNDRSGRGSDFTGWLDWPEKYDKEEFRRIREVSREIRERADVLVVCGIGGSYLGARSAIEFLKGLYPGDKPEIIFAGNTFSSVYLKQLLAHLKGRSVYLNVISKSGTTTETSVSFRLFQQYIEENFPAEASRRIIATTDRSRGTLKALADRKGYRTFTIPDDIGGRYSVFTPVGLLPIAAAGIDIDELMAGSHQAMEDLRDPDLAHNQAYQYAVIRRMMQAQGKAAEMLVSYDPGTAMIAEWWKQLFGESEGKEGKGILPLSVTFTTDLHSMGQFIQEGTKLLFETVLKIDRPLADLTFPSDRENLDGMNYLSGKSLDWVNKMAMQGTLEAHSRTGGVPNVIIEVPDQSPRSYGYLIYFFFKACAMSCYLLDINPFNQPGVEIYKKNMFRLLGKD